MKNRTFLKRSGADDTALCNKNSRFGWPRQALLFAILVSTGIGPADAQDVSDRPNDLANRFVAAASSYVPDTIQFQFKAQSNSFGHLSRPWETRHRESTGVFQAKPDKFVLKELALRDSLTAETKSLYTDETLYQCDGDNRPIDVSVLDHQSFLRLSCRYTPAVLLKNAIASCEAANENPQSNGIALRKEGKFLIGSGTHGDENYEIHFDEESRLKKIVWLGTHEMWGDQSIELTYLQQITNGTHLVPTAIMEKTFETTTFQTEILEESKVEIAIPVPSEHRLQAEEAPTTGKIVIEKYSDNVTFLHLTDCDSRTTLIEFRDFLMVIDSPISSANGKRILQQIDEMKLEKPVKYFAFGHHHPHYLGGVRPFISAGATVLTTRKIAPYVKQIAEFKHTRQPDELEQNPTTLRVEIFEDQTEITDGDYSIKVFDIGEKSRHTNDYLLFYFPKERLILQDDGIWLRPNQPLNERTQATYAAIKQLNVDVTDCIQSWPTQNFGVETRIKFNDLKVAVEKSDQQD